MYIYYYYCFLRRKKKNGNNNNNNNYHLLNDRYMPGTVIRIYMDLTHLNSVWQVLLLFWYKRWGTRVEPGCLIPEQSIFTSIHAIAEATWGGYKTAGQWAEQVAFGKDSVTQ